MTVSGEHAAPTERIASDRRFRQTPVVHCLRRGTARIATGREALRTVVGAGFAVVVYLPDGRGGGVAHLSVPSTALYDPHEPPDPADQRRLTHLLTALERGPGIRAGAVAEIIGGADVLRILTAGDRDRRALRRAAAIEAFLEPHGVDVVRLEVGGTQSRRIIADFSASETVIHSEGATPLEAGPSAPPTPPPVDPPAVARGTPAVTSRGVRPAAPTSPHREGPATLRSWIMVDMGQLAVARPPVRLVAVLGSCVGVVLYDPVARLGGLAHVMLPQCMDRTDEPARYAETAVEALVARMASEGGSQRRLRARLVGGAAVIFQASQSSLFNLGDRNVEVARRMLRAAGIPVLEEVVGGRIGRKVTVDLEQFTLDVKLLGSGPEEA